MSNEELLKKMNEICDEFLIKELDIEEILKIRKIKEQLKKKKA